MDAVTAVTADMATLADTLAFDIATVLTLIGLVAACIRLYLGPSRSDRVVALDLITVLLIAISSLAALRFDDDAYLDLGLTLALVGFLATVAFARYVESEPESARPRHGVGGGAPERNDANDRKDEKRSGSGADDANRTGPDGRTAGTNEGSAT